MDRPRQPDSATTAAAAEPFTPAQMRTLKIAIVVMSIILVIGFCAIIARLMYLATRPAPPPASSAVVTLPSTSLKSDISLALPAGAGVRSMSLAPGGDRLAIHFDAPTGSGIVILDLRTGTPASTVRLTPAP